MTLLGIEPKLSDQQCHLPIDQEPPHKSVSNFSACLYLHRLCLQKLGNPVLTIFIYHFLLDSPPKKVANLHLLFPRLSYSFTFVPDYTFFDVHLAIQVSYFTLSGCLPFQK
jgi:hypothetical protein